MLPFDAAVDDAHSNGVVATNGSGQLGMPHLLEGKLHTFCLNPYLPRCNIGATFA